MCARPGEGRCADDVDGRPRGYILGRRVVRSTATARDATFNTTDRCDGTLTEVGRGRVTLAVKGRPKPITVRAGRAYLVKAKIFAVRPGKRPIGA